MADEIRLVTYANQQVTPQNDAVLTNLEILNNGIIFGCEVTIKNASTLHINSGMGVIYGREFEIVDSDISVPLPGAGTELGQLYIHIDLANTSEPIQILVETGASLTPMVDDANLNVTTGITEYQLATFNVSAATISDLVVTFENTKDIRTELGDADISGIGDGSVKGAINEHESDIAQINIDLTNNTCANLLNPTAQTQTINGVTFTNNGDGTYTVNGTASGGDAGLRLMTFNDFSILENTKLVGCPVGGTFQTYLLYISCYNGSTWVKNYVDSGDGVLVSNIPPEANAIRLNISIRNGYTANNFIFKPMLTTDLNAKYDDYVPYTGDSGRLNEDVAEIYDKVLDTSDIAPALAVDYAKSVSHIGMIIQSTTLDTEAKVKAIYGGTSWSLIQGKMLLGASSSHAVNSTGGSETHTLAVENLPSHSHVQQGTFTSGGQSANHTHGFTTGDVDANSALSTHVHGTPMQLSNAGGGRGDWGLTAAGAFGGKVLLANGAGGGAFSLSSQGPSAYGHTHSGATGGVSADHSHNTTISGNTGTTGSGTAFDTMPPYKTVYMWERTA